MALNEVAEGVWVHESECIQSNTVVVRGESGALLVDPGLTRDELATIADFLRELGLPVVAGFSTHPDWDHVLWHPAFGDPPRYGTARNAAAMRELLATPDWEERLLAGGLPPEIEDEVPTELFGQLTALPPDAALVPWDGPDIRILEHRGHVAGHAALLIEERGVLVAGDMLSDVLVPMLDLDAANQIEDYLAALDLLEGVADRVEVVVPGHGSVGRADEVRARIELDRAYVHALRDRREVSDPRIGASAKPGWEWVSDIHSWQQQRMAELG